MRCIMYWASALLPVCLVIECYSFHVELRAPRYVSFGNSALLRCNHSVSHEELHKVEWLQNGRKIWQYVKGRKPPYRNFTTTGAQIDPEHSNYKQVMLTNLDFEASGLYTCEVSTEKPIIYTKPSEEHELIVMLNQIENPRITFRKPVYTVGDWLEVNCTSGTARPTPHITWLLNGKKVEGNAVKSFVESQPSIATTQLRFQITEDHIDRLELTCLATIPGFLGHSVHRSEYADHRANSISVDVVSSVPMPHNHSTIRHCPVLTITLLLLLLYGGTL